MSTAEITIPAVSEADALSGAEEIIRTLAFNLQRTQAQVISLRRLLGLNGGNDGLMTLERIRALENASDAARTHLLGGPVTRQEALDACERARRAS